jgi:hypothetical protein
MARLAADTLESLRRALQERDYLRDLLGEIEQLHRVVFHGEETVDWGRVRRSAEQILIAEIVHRHHGNPDGVLRQLQDMERGGKPWRAALRDLAATTHSYYTTPLGLVMRKDLFGPEAVFISFMADEWIRGTAGLQP